MTLNPQTAESISNLSKAVQAAAWAELHSATPVRAPTPSATRHHERAGRFGWGCLWRLTDELGPRADTNHTITAKVQGATNNSTTEIA
jgi:hypothetical protein